MSGTGFPDMKTRQRQQREHPDKSVVQICSARALISRQYKKPLISGTIAPHVRFTFWYISLPSSAKKKRQMENVNTWRLFSFSFWTWIPYLWIQLLDSSANWTCRNSRSSLSDVFCGVAASQDWGWWYQVLRWESQIIVLYNFTQNRCYKGSKGLRAEGNL